MTRIIRSTALALGFLTAPGLIGGGNAADDLSKLFVQAPLELPDSDTSSLGPEMPPEETPFMLRCTDARTFNDTAKRLKAKGMIVGVDALDKTIIMVFKYEDGSINFARSDKQGKTLCVFGQIAEPDIDLGVVMIGPKRSIQN